MQNLFCLILGNNGILNYLIISLTINCFDDEFLGNFMPKEIIKFIDLNIQKKYKVRKPQVISLIENLEKIKNKNKKNTNINTIESNLKYKDYNNLDKEENIKKNEIEIENENENTENNYYTYEEDIEISNSTKKQNGFLYEIIMFLNFLCAYLLFLFLYQFPIKDVLINELKFNTNKTKEFLKKYIFYYIYIITFVILFNFIIKFMQNFIKIFLKNEKIIDRIFQKNSKMKNKNKNNDNDNYNDTNNNIDNIIISFVFILFNIFKFMKNILIFLFLFIYFIHNTKIFYSTFDIKLKSTSSIFYLENIFEKNFNINLSRDFFDKFNLSHKYNILKEFQSKYSRYELEIKFKNGEDNKDKFEFLSKRFGVQDNNNLLFFNLYFPRLDYKIYSSALSEKANTDLYLIILAGKIIERNAIVLDLLKYNMRNENNFISKKLFLCFFYIFLYFFLYFFLCFFYIFFLYFFYIFFIFFFS
jgi:hypothetical protein